MTDTRTICEIDGSGFWTGQARDIGPLDGRPPTWVETSAPTRDTAVPAGQGWTWAGTWVLTKVPALSFADIKAAKLTALTAACAAEIVDGYQSSALGSDHTYPAKPTDQINMLGSVTASLLPGLAADWTTPFWCADATGTWSFQMHTAAQIQAAGADGKAAVATAQTKLATLSAQTSAAKAQSDLDAIAW